MLKAILIDCIPPGTPPDQAKDKLTEAENLVQTFGGVVILKKIQKKLVPNYKTYIGSGKINEIIEENQSLKANILIINNELKPRQTYNIAEQLRKAKSELKVWDRIDLILKIFQKHATTKEAILEIELASIKHMGPRIFGMGMELSRQAGGIGTRGVGETNIEFMRRHLAKMEQRIIKHLEECKKVRRLHRDNRRRQNMKTIGIIGYTNAGKSSLLNALTNKGAYEANKLFATLDTRVGTMHLESKVQDNEYQPPTTVLISDTIGFIQDLPPQLIKSFQSTLEETIEADLLLHTIDATDTPAKIEHKLKVVNEILAQINALHKPTIFVINKIDLVTSPTTKKQIKEIINSLMEDPSQNPTNQASYPIICASAKSKEGLSKLKTTIRDFITNHS